MPENTMIRASWKKTLHTCSSLCGERTAVEHAKDSGPVCVY